MAVKVTAVVFAVCAFKSVPADMTLNVYVQVKAVERPGLPPSRQTANDWPADPRVLSTERGRQQDDIRASALGHVTTEVWERCTELSHHTNNNTHSHTHTQVGLCLRLHT